mmetsp:Transcript_47037/g.123430  ORF Transcript_47037/g.123430 Transcript_47037/m.123430 type:complete len:322 (-) Transcript_47037:2009-2974(-)
MAHSRCQAVRRSVRTASQVSIRPCYSVQGWRPGVGVAPQPGHLPHPCLAPCHLGEPCLRRHARCWHRPLRCRLDLCPWAPVLPDECRSQQALRSRHCLRRRCRLWIPCLCPSGHRRPRPLLPCRLLGRPCRGCLQRDPHRHGGYGHPSHCHGRNPCHCCPCLGPCYRCRHRRRPRCHPRKTSDAHPCGPCRCSTCLCLTARQACPLRHHQPRSHGRSLLRQATWLVTWRSCLLPTEAGSRARHMQAALQSSARSRSVSHFAWPWKTRSSGSLLRHHLSFDAPSVTARMLISWSGAASAHPRPTSRRGSRGAVCKYRRSVPV